MSTAPVVNVEGLWCAHSARFVLRDLNFRIEPGEIAIIVGINGVGKSTLLATIAGALSAARGNVSVFGYPRRKSVEAERAARRKALYLPDDGWLPGELQVREYLDAAAELFEIPIGEAIDQIDALLELFSLDRSELQSIGSLSTGQKKKVGLCAALLSRRELLLLDEPFSGGLDPAGTSALRKVLKHQSREQGKTIVLTTPVAEVVAELADRLLVLSDGRLAHNLDRQSLGDLLNQTALSADALNDLLFPDAVRRVQRYLEQSSVSGANCPSEVSR
ncbi:ATP-binding cassette domain-containing protein [Schlesneria sp. T3-172]|uniref:ATP-binding cassette domain-containing protein n=1 Tax=Schlesneria sphaerica TaxID=3373610 RepID=UPI0037CB00AA